MFSISEFNSYYISLWENSSDEIPIFSKSFKPGNQSFREAQFDSFQEKLKTFQSPSSIKKLKDERTQTKFFPVFKSFMQTVFDFEDKHLNIILSQDFKEVTRGFFYKAKKFGPELKPENIYQAMRNVWIINGLQLIMGKRVELTPSAFAYSMIYPYSDNFLDDPLVSNEEKIEFSKRFRSRLEGNNVEPESFTEVQLFRLFEMIEDEYPREYFSEVYESLYAIHDGQTKSLKLKKQSQPDFKNVLEISFEKGGASVLADGYLAAGNLTTEQEKALFGYGVYLQLLDDIQDIKEDNEDFTSTLFTDLTAIEREKLLCKTIHFGRKALQDMFCFNSENTIDLLDLMNYSLETMIIESLGTNTEFYPAGFLSQMEIHSPITYEYIRKRKKESSSQRFAIFKKYFDQVPAEAIMV